MASEGELAVLMPSATRLSTGKELNSIPQTPASLARSGAASVPRTPALPASHNGTMSVIEVEAILQEKVSSKHSTLLEAFKKYDKEQTLSVTRGEFRRVLEAHCLQLNTEQFEAVMAKVTTNPNGTIRYVDFVEKFSGVAARRPLSVVNGLNSSRSSKPIPRTANSEGGIDHIERMIKDKLSESSVAKEISRALKICDFQRNGRVMRHDLRRVLEQHCFRLSEDQFQKLCNRHDHQNSGYVQYKNFLRRMGVKLDDNTQIKGLTTFMPEALPKGLAPIRAKTFATSRGLIVQPDTVTNIQALEAIFRKKMRYNYDQLRKACLSFDPSLSGFISVEDLHSVVNNFCMPVSEQLLSELLQRANIRGNGRVEWESLLNKFQDPQGPGNGQTVTIGKNHKFFAGRGNEQMSIGSILRLLDSRVKGGFSSLSKAFLQFDRDRNGEVSRSEFRRVLETFSFKMTDEQFKQVMLLINPHNKQRIDYHQFLSLFEEREDISAHKWLVPQHRFNDQPRPLVLAWQTIEEILRERISDKWLEFRGALAAADKLNEGVLQTDVLKQLIDDYILPVSDDHFDAMMAEIVNREDDLVSYGEWLERLGVTVEQGDTAGLSHQVQQGSVQAEAKRYADLITRHTEADDNTEKRANIMSTDEIISRLKDRIRQHYTELRRAFTDLDLQRKGKICRKDFKAAVRRFGFLLSDEQFKSLWSAVSVGTGGLTYTDFLEAFQDPRTRRAQPPINQVNNHHVNPVRGDAYGLTALQAEQKLRQKIRENFPDLQEAFYKFSPTHNGFVSRDDLRRVLDSMMIVMSSGEFQTFCSRLGLINGNTLDYHGFLQHFETTDDLETGHKWLKSDHRVPETKPVRMMSAEEVRTILALKAHQRYVDLATAFKILDTDRNAKIKRAELREALIKFIIPISKDEFEKLWNMLDPSGQGFLMFDDFLHQLGAAGQFAPGDQMGFSADVLTGSFLNLEEHHIKQQKIHEKTTKSLVHNVSFSSPQQLLARLKDLLRDKFTSLRAAFHHCDRLQRGYITATELQTLLTELDVHVNDDTFATLCKPVRLEE